MPDEPGVGLAEAIKTLRAEFAEALADGAGQAVAFEVGQVSLEFQVLVTRETSGTVKARFWVVDAEIGGKGGSAVTHRLAVTLRPVARQPDGSATDLTVADPASRRPR